MKSPHMTLLPQLSSYVAEREREALALSTERKALLAPLLEYVATRRAAGGPIVLNYICTHNSRRSHFGQIWGQVAAFVHGIEGVTTHSGGTEATAFNPRAVAALERAGFVIETPGGQNPTYLVRYGEDLPPLRCFSKTFDHPESPSEEFGAVMTCTDADQNCPVIIGATRISLPYKDPKEADDTDQERSRYDERCAQIASEMLYVFSRV